MKGGVSERVSGSEKCRERNQDKDRERGERIRTTWKSKRAEKHAHMLIFLPFFPHSPLTSFLKYESRIKMEIQF